MQVYDLVRYQNFMNYETQLQNSILNQTNINQRLINQNGIITIPVVVHILHKGEAIGVGANLDYGLISSQIDVLNEDFRRLNLNANNTPLAFRPFASDFGIQFKLACIDPNGFETDGIIRKKTNKSHYEYIGTNGNLDLPDEESIGIKINNENGSAPWPTDKYLNIWVVDFNDGTAGYSSFPQDFQTRANFDGVVIKNTAFGRNSGLVGRERGRTAVHEIGHWLGLFHTFGNGGACNTDFVPDTPPQATNNNDCPNFPHLSNCVGNSPNGDMFMNYMDYSNDDCMNLFTTGQRARSRDVFRVGAPRNSLIENSFKLLPRNSTLYCNGKIKLQNLNCFPVTWSVLSGPAVIVSSNNSEATITSSVSGNITIRATAGNYVSDQTYQVSQESPTIVGINYNNGLTSGNPVMWYNPSNSIGSVNEVCIGFGFPNRFVDAVPFGSSENEVT